jgi:restriction endonuclease S subunit
MRAERLQKGLMQQLLTGRLKPDGTPRTRDEFCADPKLGLVPNGWIVEKGSKLAEKITKGQSPKWQGFDYTTAGMLFVTSENVRDGFLDLSEPKFLPVEFNEKIKGSELRIGDILINLVGASIGRSCIFNAEHRPANVNQAVCVFRPKRKVASKYLAYYLRLHSTQNRLLASQVETARSNLSLGDVRRLKFALPRDEDEQNEIVDRLDQITLLIEAKKRKIVALQRLKKSLMQNLLTGRIRLRVESTQREKAIA